MDTTGRINAFATPSRLERILPMIDGMRQVVVDVLAERKRQVYLHQLLLDAEGLKSLFSRGESPPRECVNALWISDRWKQWCLEEMIRFYLAFDSLPLQEIEMPLMVEYFRTMCEVGVLTLQYADMSNQKTTADDLESLYGGAIDRKFPWYELEEILVGSPEIPREAMLKASAVNVVSTYCALNNICSPSHGEDVF